MCFGFLACDNSKLKRTWTNNEVHSVTLHVVIADDQTCLTCYCCSLGQTISFDQARDHWQQLLQLATVNAPPGSNFPAFEELLLSSSSSSSSTTPSSDGSSSSSGVSSTKSSRKVQQQLKHLQRALQQLGFKQEPEQQQQQQLTHTATAAAPGTASSTTSSSSKAADDLVEALVTVASGQTLGQAVAGSLTVEQLLKAHWEQVSRAHLNPKTPKWRGPAWEEMWRLMKQLAAAHDLRSSSSVTAAAAAGGGDEGSRNGSAVVAGTGRGGGGGSGWVLDVASLQDKYLDEMGVTPITPAPYPGM